MHFYSDGSSSSSSNGKTFLLFLFGDRMRRRRQLQHGGLLTFLEAGEQNDLPIRELQCIMMCRLLILVDLTEPSHSVNRICRPSPLQVRNLIERDLGARQHAHRRRIADRLVCTLEANSTATEVMTHQLVCHYGRTRLGMLETEITHESLLLLEGLVFTLNHHGTHILLRHLSLHS